ncbi:MAG: regulatory protein RecX [Rothia sp. (in: high G+C Gram-positive bacteria)]|nr:regulatory protein RecX [Rothia sp. (in: high G+C Gram-positive bacteria)]
MSNPNEFPAWHPAALGESEDLPGTTTYATADAERVGVPYGGSKTSSAQQNTLQKSTLQRGSRATGTSEGSKTGGASRPRRYREGYKKGFRKPKPNPHSPFAPAFGAAPEEPKKPARKKSQVQFRADSSLAQADDALPSDELLIQGTTPGGRGRKSAKQPESEFTQAKNIVLNQLAASAKSRAQLQKKLADKEISPEVAEDVLQRFEDVKLINDEEFAQMYVRTRANVKKLSRNAIRRELKQKGVEGELAEVALEQRSEEDERADAHELVRKKIRPSMDFSDRSEKDKIMRRLVSMLARKGYPSGMAFSVVREEIDAYVEEQGIDSADSFSDYF